MQGMGIFLEGGRRAHQNMAFSISQFLVNWFLNLFFFFLFFFLEGRWEPFGINLCILLDLTSAVLLLFLLEGETGHRAVEAGGRSLKGWVFLRSVYNGSASSKATLIFSGQRAAYPDQFLY